MRAFATIVDEAETASLRGDGLVLSRPYRVLGLAPRTIMPLAAA